MLLRLPLALSVAVPVKWTASCRCGHLAMSHRHYRRGSDCSLCKPGECNRFRGAGLRARLQGSGGDEWGRP